MLMGKMFHSFAFPACTATIHNVYGRFVFSPSSRLFVKSHSVNGHNSLMYENIFEHDSKGTLDALFVYMSNISPRQQ